MRLVNVIFVVPLTIALISGALSCDSRDVESPATITSFEECAEAGNPVMESYPRQCRTDDGDLFVEDVGNELEKLDIIRVDSPRPNSVIQSPLVVEGEARGMWYFEGDFPVKLLDADGGVIGRFVATAQGEWTTEDFVPFRAQIEFTEPTTKKGTLILKKDNPSGLPEHDDELRVPVTFAGPAG
jgi:hypothetical protein